ncbi:MAG: hypothetical protein KME30_16285 [Iphinoe sp. HA4291-MV1]|nr:hypothetical protein [Iphinoe sp. HA4291-MV1]
MVTIKANTCIFLIHPAFMQRHFFIVLPLLPQHKTSILSSVCLATFYAIGEMSDRAPRSAMQVDRISNKPTTPCWLTRCTKKRIFSSPPTPHTPEFLRTRCALAFGVCSALTGKSKIKS